MNRDGEEPRISVDIPSEQQRRIGVGLTEIIETPIRHTVRTVGIVQADETREAHVHLRVSGWVEDILADYVGKAVRRGEPLLRLYSPELVSTQDELLSALRTGGALRSIAKTVRERLVRFGMSEDEIDAVIKERAAHRLVTLVSPIAGYVVGKSAIKGMYVTPETELYYIADIAKVWVQATLYESDVVLTHSGDRARVTSAYDPGLALDGVIDFISPDVDPATRTAKARIRIDNADLKLKPGMFANVEIRHDLGKQLIVPADAVIDTGMRRIVFVLSEETQFEPREVELGTRVDQGFVVLSGLKAGERVVSAANFLIDAESKIQAVLRQGVRTKGHVHGEH
jgi:multidrug efflux pump subunit AcrA (membrane-fusion protein)